MPLVEVWKCPKSGKLFENRVKYAKHLQKVREANYGEYEAMKYQRQDDKLMGRMTTECRNFDDILVFIRDNWMAFCYRAARENSWKFSSRSYKNVGEAMAHAPNLNKVEFTNMRFGMLSNSHNAPFGKPTNWGSKPDLPKGFLGYSGQIHVYYEWDSCFSVGDMLSGTAIKTGSGGGGNHTRYDISLFLDDWPGLSEEAALSRLRGDDSQVNQYYKYYS